MTPGDGWTGQSPVTIYQRITNDRVTRGAKRGAVVRCEVFPRVCKAESRLPAGSAGTKGEA